MNNKNYPAFENYNPRQAALAEARALLTQAAQAAMEAGDLPAAELPAFIVEVPADAKNGDIASNIAMAGARTWRKAPKMIAETLLAHLPSLADSCFTRAEVAGPGFINLFLSPAFWAGVVMAACSSSHYGRTDHGQGRKYNVEFVSANPTGPMHMGNARGGVLGDTLANVLSRVGYNTWKEFYVNDAGNQVHKFAQSIHARYMQIILGEDGYEFPEKGYQGEDIKELAQAFYAVHGDSYKDAPEEKWLEDMSAFGLERNIPKMKADLNKYGIEYDQWFLESELHNSGYVAQTVDLLAQKGWTYEKDGALWLDTTGLLKEKYLREGRSQEQVDKLDLKDDVLRRANGFYTYFAADIAYHRNKFAERGFDKVINVWGADHHGHVARMKGAMDAIGLDGSRLDVVLMQMVNLMQNGQPVRMSKRTGNAITLTDLLEEVPIDSARFLFNMHEAGSSIDFDLDQAVKTDNDNPVYYVQYAHARICSILRKLESTGVEFLGTENANATLLTDPAEMDLIRMLAAFPQEIVLAAEKYDPSRINRFVIDLASAFHRFYGSCRIQEADPALQQARIALCIGVRNVIRSVLTMFKIQVPDKM